ncbi:MAG: restriction endonuclease subunit S [Brevinema sp.]
MEFPKDWKIVPLSEVADIVGGGTPSTSNPEYWNAEISWFTPTEIGKQKFVSKSSRHISKKGVKESSARVLPIHTVLFTSRATIGEMAILEKEACTNQGFQSLIAKENSYYEYLYYLQFIIKGKALALASGSTFLEISKTNLGSITIPLPPLDEQKRIAHILASQDKVLEALAKLIALKEQQFRGLIQKLISQPAKAGAKGFPKDWKNVISSDILDIRDGTHDSPKLLTSGIKFITSKNIINNVLNMDNVSYISANDATQINQRSAVSQGDILFSMIGTVGQVAIVENVPDFCIKNVGLIKNKKSEVDTYFLFYYLQSPLFQTWLQTRLDGGIQKFFSLGALRGLKIPLPPLDEQKRIVHILDSTQKAIDCLKRKRELLKQQKRGLMQVLLTGKIRV